MKPSQTSASPQPGKAAPRGKNRMRPMTPRLDPGAAQDRCGRDRRRGVGERHPAMQGHERDLHAEAQDDERERRIPPRRSDARSHDVANLRAAVRLARRQHDEGDQEHRLAEQRKRHIDGAGAERAWLLVMRDKVIGGDADERINEVESQKVGGDEHAETACHGQQPGNRKAVGVRPALPFPESEEADDEPDERRRSEQQAARLIERETDAQRRQLGAERRAGNRERSGAKRGEQQRVA